jgi:tetratricopeptide (TPR) repeat protein
VTRPKADIAIDKPIDVSALGLTPLALRDMGEWDPAEEYWGEEDEPRDAWEQAIIAHGKRRRFEMEQVIPGADPEDFDSDPIIEAAERKDAGDYAGARAILMELLAEDLRCLDAHAHLGNIEFDDRPDRALRHYEIGAAIGELSLGPTFRDALPWGLIDNRPYLRCLHGKGLCLWRLGRVQDATAVFHKLLWLNPSDNQGARFNLAAVEDGKTWDEMETSDR